MSVYLDDAKLEVDEQAELASTQLLSDTDAATLAALAAQLDGISVAATDVAKLSLARAGLGGSPDGPTYTDAIQDASRVVSLKNQLGQTISAIRVRAKKNLPFNFGVVGPSGPVLATIPPPQQPEPTPVSIPDVYTQMLAGEFEGEVSVTATGLPTGVTVTPTPVILPQGYTAILVALTLEVSNDADPGSSTITIEATGAGLTRQDTFTLTLS